ncbi:MAG: hypothetical protein EXS31_00235 [Pedosphaera sp.]|nr:hypothetical protein [Pedosphaera sp.]
MKSGTGRQLLVAALVVLGAYVAVFLLIERSRPGKGPWSVTFSTDVTGRPTVTATHEKLNLRKIEFRFEGERLPQTNLQSTVIFDKPVTNTPFGSVVFIDTTFLPGTVVLDLFGHEIQLLRRVLSVNKREVPWQPEMTIDLKQTDKLASEGRNKPRRVEPKGEPAR